MTYVAPGLLAYATFMTAIFQSLFAAFIRMRYQRTWEGQLTTQVELTHVVWGEVLWAGLLATMYVVIVSAVLAVLPVGGAARARSALAAGAVADQLRGRLRVRAPSGSASPRSCRPSTT